MKRIVFCALAALLALSLLAAPALAIDLEPGVGDGFYVVDSANVLSTETEQLVAAYNATILEPACDSAQLVVATVRYLDQDADLAATELLNDWGVGSASQSNGMLLLLVTEEYRGWLAVGQGLSGAFDDDTAGQYLDAYFWDYIDKDQFDQGVQTLTEKLAAWYADYYDVDLASYTDTGSNTYGPYGDHYVNTVPTQSTGGAMSIFTVVFFVLFLLLILWIIGAASRFSRMRRWGYTGGFFPVFWFGGRRRYNDWYRRQPPPPPGPGPGPGGPAGFGGPGGFMGGGFGRPRPSSRPSTFSRPSAPRGGGFRSGGGFHGGGHGGGFGGHSGGGGAGRR